MHIYCIALTIFFPLFVLILVDLSKELMFSIHHAYCDPYNGTFFSLRDHRDRDSQRSVLVMLHQPLFIIGTNP